MMPAGCLPQFLGSFQPLKTHLMILLMSALCVGGRGMAGESRGVVRALDQPGTQQVCIAKTNRESDGCIALLIQENQTSDEGV